MSENPNEQIFNDLFRYLEVLETQNAAILQLLKDKKVVSEKKFASYLEQAAVASDVKWRAARVRMEHLLASVPEPKPESPEVKAEAAPKTEKESSEAAKPDDKQPQVKKPQQDSTANESQDKSSEARTNQTGQDQHSTSAPEVEVKAAGKVNEGKNNPDDSKKRTPGDAVSADNSKDASLQSSQPQKVDTMPSNQGADESSPAAREEKDGRERSGTSGENQQSSITHHEEQEKVA